MSKRRIRFSSILKLNENGKEYFKTFWVTLLIVIIFGVCNVFYMVHKILNDDYSKPTAVDTVFESYLVDILIDRNKELGRTFPKSYEVNMRLGVLYSYKKDYVSAEKEFINSVEKSYAYAYLPRYQLAKLYVKMNRLQDSENIMNSINDKPNKKLIRYKGEIFNMLGDAYLENGYDALAIMKYEKALTYLEVINKNVGQVHKNLVKANISIADKYVQVGKIDEAIMALEKAYEIAPKNIIVNYKLGLLYMDNKPYKAYDLFTFVQKKSPQTMNYDVFYDLFERLEKLEESKGNYTNAELYRKRALQYQKFVQNNLLYDKDLFFDLHKMEVHNDIAAQEYIINMKFALQNNSSLDIDRLNIDVIFKDGNKVISEYNQKIYDETKIFEAGTMSIPIVVGASEPYNIKEKQNGEITVDVYAYKYPKYKIKLYSNKLKKPNINS